MNSFNMLLLLFLLNIINIGCEPEDCPMPPKIKTCWEDTVATSLNYFTWRIPNNTDTTESIMIQPVIIGDKFLIVEHNGFPTNNLTLREIKTGELIWKNTDPLVLNLTPFAFEYYVYKDKLYNISGTASTIPSIRVIDLTTGSIIHKKFDHSIGNLTTRLGDYIYFQKEFGEIPFTDSVQFWRFNMDSYESEYVFTVERIREYSNDLVSLVSYSLDNGDEVLFYQQRMIDLRLKRRIDTRAYNITKGKIIWGHDSVDYLRNGSIFPSVYKNNKVYFKAAAMLYCFNAETGAIIWQQDVARRTNGDMLLGNMLVEEGRVIVHSNRGFVCSYDAETGVHQWTASDWADTINNLLYYKGKVYSASGADGNMHSLDIKTGKKYWNEISPNLNCFPNADFATAFPNLDPATGILLIEDRYFTMAVDLNK
jgi:outer membrane protein assembly factor BamB